MCLFALGDHDQRRTQYAVGDGVALLQYGDNGVRFLLRIDHADGLMLVRIKLFASGADFVERILLEGSYQLLERQFDTRLEALDGLFRHGQRGFEAVLDGQQFAGKALDGELVRLGNVFLSTAANIFAFGLGAQPGIVVFGRFKFEGAELLLDARQRVGVFGDNRLCAYFQGAGCVFFARQN